MTYFTVIGKQYYYTKINIFVKTECVMRKRKHHERRGGASIQSDFVKGRSYRNATDVAYACKVFSISDVSVSSVISLRFLFRYFKKFSTSDFCSDLLRNFQFSLIYSILYEFYEIFIMMSYGCVYNNDMFCEEALGLSTTGNSLNNIDRLIFQRSSELSRKRNVNFWKCTRFS